MENCLHQMAEHESHEWSFSDFQQFWHEKKIWHVHKESWNHLAVHDAVVLFFFEPECGRSFPVMCLDQTHFTNFRNPSCLIGFIYVSETYNVTRDPYMLLLSMSYWVVYDGSIISSSSFLHGKANTLYIGDHCISMLECKNDICYDCRWRIETFIAGRNQDFSWVFINIEGKNWI